MLGQYFKFGEDGFLPYSLQVHNPLINMKFEAMQSKLLIESLNIVAHKPVAGQRPQK
jgi:hypothetical protein